MRILFDRVVKRDNGVKQIPVRKKLSFSVHPHYAQKLSYSGKILNDDADQFLAICRLINQSPAECGCEWILLSQKSYHSM